MPISTPFEINSSRHGRETYKEWNWTLRLSYQFTKDVYCKALFQGNDYDDHLLANVLFGYTFLPGSTLYLVYNSDYFNDRGDLAVRQRALFLKVSWLLGV